LYYASRGWPVLPLYSVEGAAGTGAAVPCKWPGKHPRPQAGGKKPSSNPPQTGFGGGGGPRSKGGIAPEVGSALLALTSTRGTAATQAWRSCKANSHTHSKNRWKCAPASEVGNSTSRVRIH